MKFIEQMIDATGEKYNTATIINALNVVYNRNPDIDEKTLIKKAYSHLKNNRSDKRTVKTKNTIEG